MRPAGGSATCRSGSSSSSRDRAAAAASICPWDDAGTTNETDVYDDAFSNFVRLRDAATPEARAVIAAEIEALAGNTALWIAQSTAFPPETHSAARDAFCAGQRHHD
jgi:hypothetical protein